MDKEIKLFTIIPNNNEIDFNVPEEIRQKTSDMLNKNVHLLSDKELYYQCKGERFSNALNFYNYVHYLFDEEARIFIEKYFVIPDFLIKESMIIKDFKVDPHIDYLLLHPKVHFYFIEAARLLYSL